MKNLREIVKEKILILDGAMGTEIQKYNLTEEDFRGERFRDLPGMMKGNNDMLNITRPALSLTGLRCHANPFQLALQCLAALRGSLLLLNHSLGLLVEP